jgi:hypothetical protein
MQKIAITITLLFTAGLCAHASGKGESGYAMAGVGAGWGRVSVTSEEYGVTKKLGLTSLADAAGFVSSGGLLIAYEQHLAFNTPVQI